MGYEYALEEQKEFGNKENKKKKRAWEVRQGMDAIWNNKLDFYDGLGIGEDHGRKEKASDDWRNIDVAAGRRARKKEEESGLNGIINKRGSAEKNHFYKNPEKQRYVGKDRNHRSDNYIKSINNLKLSEIKEEKQEKARQKFKEEAKSRLENIKNIRVKKNLKKAGMVAGGVALAAGAAYGIKKHHDMVRARKAERQRLEEENKGLKEQLANKK